jgi:TolB-like protein
MTAALQRATIAVALPTLALVAIAPAISSGSRAFAQPSAPAGATGEPAAVLSFINISGDSADDWIGTGIAESLASDLNRAGVAAIRAETESVPRATEVGLGSPDAIIATGQTLRASWIVTGAYQRIGDRLRVTARVFDAATAAVMDAVTVDGAFSELFDIQDQVAAQVRAALASGSRRAAGQPTVAQPPVPAPESTAPPRRGPGSLAGLPGRGPGPMAGRPGGGPGGPMGRRPGPGGPMTGRPGRGPGGPMTGRPGGPASESGARPGSAPPAQPAGFSSVTAAPGVMIDGPPAPVAPEIITRDAAGRATVRAVRLNAPLRVDGVLDDGIYETVPSIEGFVQQLPIEGAPTTERTEAWVFFSDDAVYVAARLWASAPESDWIANEMQRDSFQLIQNEYFSAAFDTFYDRRNGFAFMINPLGGFFDFQITDEGNPNSDWNPVWDSSVGRFDGGWTVEMEIPFKSIRFRPGAAEQLWGLQLGRHIRWKNERTYLNPVPISGGPGEFRVSAGATLTGIDVPEGNRTFEVKPYAIGGLATDVGSGIRNDGSGDAGIDVKFGVTENLTADFTYNTDFAQVEVDEQQVNLTRFNLFFPEKREFFLEGRGIFDFARGGFSGSFGGALRRSGQGGGFFGGNAPTIFYSRQIGLQNRAVVPIVGGGRVTGKIGAFDVGALNIQTDDDALARAEMTNFTVVRLKRDILRRSTIGGIFTNRSVALAGDGSSQAYGADATFSFYENVSLLGYVARTQVPDPGRQGDDLSYQGRFNYGGDRYGFQAEHLLVEKNFIPEVGFLRRDNFRRTYTTGRFSPRPRSLDNIRQFRFEGSFDYIEAADLGIVETRQSQLGFSTELESSDRFGVSVADNYEFLHREFTPGPDDIAFPVGGYSFFDVEGRYSPGAQRRLNGTLTVRAGEYFDGNIRSVGFSRGRMEITQQLSMEPSVSVNWIDSPRGAFRTDLIVSRVNYTFTPRMFFSGLIQYNSSSNTVSNNLRLRWEYSPGSELFVVYTEDRETDPLRPDRFSDLRNRGFVVKMNRLFRF